MKIGPPFLLHFLLDFFASSMVREDRDPLVYRVEKIGFQNFKDLMFYPECSLQFLQGHTSGSQACCSILCLREWKTWPTSKIESTTWSSPWSGCTLQITLVALSHPEIQYICFLPMIFALNSIIVSISEPVLVLKSSQTRWNENLREYKRKWKGWYCVAVEASGELIIPEPELHVSAWNSGVLRFERPNLLQSHFMERIVASLTWDSKKESVHERGISRSMISMKMTFGEGWLATAKEIHFTLQDVHCMFSRKEFPFLDSIFICVQSRRVSLQMRTNTGHPGSLWKPRDLNSNQPDKFPQTALNRNLVAWVVRPDGR